MEKTEWGSGSMLRLGALPSGKSALPHAHYHVLSHVYARFYSMLRFK
jgi:hypothetical protein